MKKLFFATLICLLAITFTSSNNAQGVDHTHRLLHIKFKPGKAAEGMEIGKKYFSKAYAEAGHSTEVFEFFNDEGDWDGIIAIPLSAGVPEAGQPHPQLVMEKLVEIAGGEEDLKKINDQFFSLVENQKMYLVKLERF